jgi:hypothetical protein
MVVRKTGCLTDSVCGVEVTLFLENNFCAQESTAENLNRHSLSTPNPNSCRRTIVQRRRHCDAHGVAISWWCGTRQAHLVQCAKALSSHSNTFSKGTLRPAWRSNTICGHPPQIFAITRFNTVGFHRRTSCSL